MNINRTTERQYLGYKRHGKKSDTQRVEYLILTISIRYFLYTNLDLFNKDRLGHGRPFGHNVLEGHHLIMEE